MNYSVCIDAVYGGKDFLTAVDEVNALGFRTIEFWGWKDKPVDELARRVQRGDLVIAGMCTNSFELTDPARRGEFIAALKETIPVAQKLGVKRLITQGGPDTGARRDFQHDSIVDTLKACAPILESSGITLMLEPLNTRVDHRGVYLSSSDEAAQILMEVDCPYVRMLFDIYHQQITEGDIISRIRLYLPLIAHFHSAGVPGRHELDNSELDYRKVFAEIDALGYDGYVGLEYNPLEAPAEGLRRLIVR